MDSEILELVARRQEVSEEIGLAKRKEGLGTRDRAREKEVRKDFQAKARALGLSRELADSLSTALIEGSVELQEAPRGRDMAGSSALVVGGAGRMGAWTCRFLSNRGADVKVWDPGKKLKGYKCVDGDEPGSDNYDIVIVASPLGRCREDLRAVLRESPRGLVFDLCSVKAHIAKPLREGAARGLTVTSVHPMFGPSAPSPRGRNVLICGCGCEDANERAAHMFSSAGANVSRIGLERHDELMAYVLGLSHLCSLVFASTLRGSDKSIAELRSVQGPSFEKQQTLARELSNESRRVYHDIQRLNPNTRKMVHAMEAALRELKSASLAADPSRFSKIMDSNREYLEVD